jgi:hypothetical protein
LRLEQSHETDKLADAHKHNLGEYMYAPALIISISQVLQPLSEDHHTLALPCWYLQPRTLVYSIYHNTVHFQARHHRISAMSDTASTSPNWFAQFPGFAYDAPAGVRSNFRRLAKARGWGDTLRNRRWAECQTTQFGNLYGTDHEKLEAWQALCREVYIKNPPGSIKRCKKVSHEYDIVFEHRVDVQAGSWKPECAGQSGQFD